MALVIRGKSKCKICQKVLKENEELIGFPHFVRDEKDELFFFTDSAFHLDCFLWHPLRDDVIKRLLDEKIITAEEIINISGLIWDKKSE